MSASVRYPDRYVITAIVADGRYKGKRVWIYWSPEGGGWWQWGPEGWAERFENTDTDKFRDAMRCATGATWTKKSCGPWYSYPDPATIEVRSVPAIVTVTVE